MFILILDAPSSCHPWYTLLPPSLLLRPHRIIGTPCTYIIVFPRWSHPWYSKLPPSYVLCVLPIPCTSFSHHLFGTPCTSHSWCSVLVWSLQTDKLDSLSVCCPNGCKAPIARGKLAAHLLLKTCSKDGGPEVLISKESTYANIGYSFVHVHL
jgi:hypothetical protein